MSSALTMAWRLAPLMWRDWAHHPLRQAVAVLAVCLGVALAWSVHVINTSALAEFSAAVRSANGEPDAVVRGPREGFDERLLDTLAAHPDVTWASPVVELETYARRSPGQPRVAVRVVGVDVLAVAPVAPDLLARPRQPATERAPAQAPAGSADAAGTGTAPDAASADRWAAFHPQHVFANAAAREKLGGAQQGADSGARTDELWLQAGAQWLPFQLRGDVAAGGPPLLVMDVAAAQHHFGLTQRLNRIDLRLRPGASPDALAPLLPDGVRLQRPDTDTQRVSNLSRAYRVNLTVLAGVALLVGSFLVYSVMALSVAQRAPHIALLGVLGLSPQERRAGVLLEGLLTGALGSGLGLLLGTGLAQLALWVMAGDLGGGYFGNPSAPPALQVQAWALLAFGLLGTAAAVVGAWVPAQSAQRLQPAQALKGLGGLGEARSSAWPGLLLCALGAALAFLPPVQGIPLAAYASVAVWLFGGVALVPWAVAALLSLVPPQRQAVALLAVERARVHRAAATAAVAGVVASLALCVALTVMVSSFREGVSRWLDQVLPADLYARSAQNSQLAEQVWFEPALLQSLASHPSVQTLQAARTRALVLDPQRPTVTLFARDLSQPAATLPLLAAPLPAQAGETGVFVSEAMVMLYGAQPGTWLTLPMANAQGQVQGVKVRVRGVWRDYARQFGTVAIALEDYRQLTGDTRLNEVAIWLRPGAAVEPLQAALRDAAQGSGLDFASSAELRQLSLRIFDRSFAVTRYLQAVAIAIGIVGVAASLSAQVLARRKEFGLLVHLGFTQRQIRRMVIVEVAAWMLAGVLVGLALGSVISAVLVHVVNPQSFHWTMDMVWPWPRLLLLCGVVLAAGVATAALTARRAAGGSAVQSVKEDW